MKTPQPMSVAVTESIQLAAQPVAPTIKKIQKINTLIEIQEAECILIELIDENVQDLAVRKDLDTTDGTIR